jgi:hypothetical protein
MDCVAKTKHAQFKITTIAQQDVWQARYVLIAIQIIAV